MRKTINIVVVALSILSIYILLSCELGLFYTIGTSAKSVEINRLLTQLSYSFLAAAIFYLLVTYLPNKINSKNSYKIWEPELVNIYLYMSTIVAILKVTYNLNKANDEITEENVKDMDKYKAEYDKIYVYVDTFINNEKKGSTSEFFSFCKKIQKNAELINERTTKIINLPTVKYIDIGLAEIISSINASPFIYTCLKLNDSLKTIDHENMKFGNEFYDFLQLYIKLSKFKFDKHSYIYTKMTIEEAKKYEKGRKERIELLKQQGFYISD